DGTHPGLRASLIMAAHLYRAVTGSDARPIDLRIDFPLLQARAGISPDVPMEAQPQLAGDGSVVLIKAAVLAPYLEVANGAKGACHGASACRGGPSAANAVTSRPATMPATRVDARPHFAEIASIASRSDCPAVKHTS